MTNFNGTLQASDTLNIATNNRAFLYGDAVFESIKAVNGKLLFWEDHYFRLMASMRILRMEIPLTFTPEFLEQELLKTLEHAHLLNKPARLRITVYRNGGGTYMPQENGVGYYAFAKAHSDPFYTLNTAPYEVELYKDHYVNPDIISTLKTTNRVLNVTASIYAQENGYDNCLLLNTRKNVVEAIQGNLFLVAGKVIKTPPLEDGCLRGIIRKQLIALIIQTDYELQETSISPFELQKADELFITNTIIGIRPISKYRKKVFTNETALELLKLLNVKARLG